MIERDAQRWLIAWLENRIGELCLTIVALRRRVAELEREQDDG